jgi:hypothetical protein
MSKPELWLAGLASAVVFATAAFSSFSSTGPTADSRWTGEALAESQDFKTALEYIRRKTDVDWRVPQVSVYSFPKPDAQAPVPPGLKDLSDHGQAAYIEAVSRDLGKSDEVRNNLGQPIIDSQQQDIREGHDPYRFDRVLVASVIKGMDMLPGDRLVWTRIMVQPINFQFAGYTIAATQNAVVKIADVEQNVSRKVSGSLAAPALPASPKIDLAADSSNKVTEAINAPFEDVGIDITPDFLRIYRESEKGSDVSGNTQIALSMITSPKQIYRTDTESDALACPRPPASRDADDLVLLVTGAHLANDRNPLSPGLASLSITPQRVLPHCRLYARVWMLYEKRVITQNRASYDEGAQSVELRKQASKISSAPNRNCDPGRTGGSPTTDCVIGTLVPIVPADDVSPAVWSIKDECGKVLSGRSGSGTPRKLVFTDYTTASDLVHWIKANHDANVIGGLDLFYGSGLLLPEKDVDFGGAGRMGAEKS